MRWELEPRDAAIIVHMRSGGANRMNPTFFADCHEALDAAGADTPGTPLVLHGEGGTFSAGLDFTDVFPRFRSGDRANIEGFFERFRSMIVRVFASPRRIVAAMNGHAFAGGLILALSCDARLIARGAARFALNEVPIGIPIPSSYVEIVRHALGDRVASEVALEGRAYDVNEAVACGMAVRAVGPETLLAEAVALAATCVPDAATAYAVTKHALRAPVLARLEGECRVRDGEAFDAVSRPESTRLQQAALDRLKSRAKG